MDWRVPFCCALYIVINLLNVSTGAARLAGVYTKRIATALTLFNTFILVSRMANLLMVPELGKLADIARSTHDVHALELQFRLILASASVGCILATLLIPTFVEVFQRGIVAFEKKGSLPKVFFDLYNPTRSRLLVVIALFSVLVTIGVMSGLNAHGKFISHGYGVIVGEGLLMCLALYIGLTSVSWIFHPEIFRPPAWMGSLPILKTLPNDFLILNVFVQGFWTVGWMAAVYAGAVHSQLAITSVSLSGIITGVATILLTIFVDPKAALITDQAAHGQKSEEQIKAMVMFLTLGNVFGTLLAQLIFAPASWIIALVASHI